MCKICRKYPCDSRCPNAEQPKSIECSVCGEEIYPGEKYYDFEDSLGLIICDDCAYSHTIILDYDDGFMKCECCGEDIDIDDSYCEVPTDGGYIQLCEQCLQEAKRIYLPED